MIYNIPETLFLWPKLSVIIEIQIPLMKHELCKSFENLTQECFKTFLIWVLSFTQSNATLFSNDLTWMWSWMMQIVYFRMLSLTQLSHILISTCDTMTFQELLRETDSEIPFNWVCFTSDVLTCDYALLTSNNVTYRTYD